MEILCFNINGKLAHFRKYYANNTAFSFTIPPRTTLMGMIAATMGWERDGYYEALSSEKMHLGVRVLSPLKKSFHRLNMLSIKKPGDMSKKWSSDFRGEGGRIQTPFEIVSGPNLVKNEVSYQVFLSPRPAGESVFEEIKNHFLNHEPVYNITLGVAGFTATINHVVLLKEDHIKEVDVDDYLYVHSAIPSGHIEELQFSKDARENYNFVEEDMMPGDFVGNKNREVQKMDRLVFSTTQYPLRVRLNTPCYQLNLPSGEVVIQFMDT